MTYYTGLARVAKTTGYPVVEVDGWEKRGHGGMSTVKTVVCHHTAGASTGNYPSLSVVRDGRADLPGPCANYGIGRDGTIYVIAAGLAYHAGAVLDPSYGNSHAIGIEAENTGTGQEWPAAQIDSYVKLCRALVDEFKLSASRVLGHKEVCSPKGRKIDPNFAKPALSMAQFRGYVQRGYYTAKAASATTSTAKPATPAKTTTAAAAQPTNYADLKVDGVKGALTVKAWQILMRSKAVGTYTRAVDGSWGTYTVKAVQTWLRKLGYYPASKYVIDGKWGKYSVLALQTFLRAKGLYTKAYLLDGKEGAATIKAEQKYLNTQN